MFSKKYEKKFAMLFILSLSFFTISYFIQGQIIFTYGDSFGLLTKMNWIFWCGFIVLLILVTFHFKNFKKFDTRYVYLTLLLFITYLIGTPFIFEYLPRFEDTWGHSFLSQEMYVNQKVNNQISYYEQFPGAFLFFGLLFQVISPYLVMRIFPFVLFGVGTISIYLLSRLLTNKKISFLATIMYILFNWGVEDNHLSPQFLSLYVYFLFMYLLVKLLTKKEKSKLPYFFLITLFMITIVFSHPLTPIFIMLILSVTYILCKQFRKILLPVIMLLTIIYLTYNIYQTTQFGYYVIMSRNFVQTLLGSDISGVSKRFVTSSPFRMIFLTSRITLTIVSVIIGGLGMFLLYKKKNLLGTKFMFSWAFSMIIFFIFSGVTTSGEYYERFILISSLPLALMSAYFISESKTSGKIIFISLLIISFVYILAKYGNEAIESTTLQKLRASCFYYNYYGDCKERQEVVVNHLDYRLRLLNETHFPVSREDIMGSSIFLDKDLNTVINSIEEHISENKLDKIYSNNIAGVYC